ncbi:MAG: hypothetical protein IT281_01555 [Ignavibacteria bacterium]|nr:hypothetical protein [Ignavibacteria bacterium]
MEENVKTERYQPLWIRITVSIVMFLLVGTVYTISYGFWVGMSAWADTKPSDANTAERFYLTYVWGGLLVIFLVVPVITTLMNIRWLWKWFYWLLSVILSALTWMLWFAIIEVTSK